MNRNNSDTINIAINISSHNISPTNIASDIATTWW
jgi:hypothetical protein